MPLVVADLIQPIGELEPDLFSATDPGGDTATRVTSYLEQAVVATDIEAAQKAYVFWRALTAKARQLKTDALKSTVGGDNSEQFEFKQITSLEVEAAGYKAEFDALVADDAGEIVDSQATTRAVRTEVVW